MTKRERQDENFYNLLGITSNVSQEELKKLQKRMALQYHPDRNGGDRGAAERFQEFNAMFATLLEPERRRRHDIRFGLNMNSRADDLLSEMNSATKKATESLSTDKEDNHSAEDSTSSSDGDFEV